MAGWWQHLLRPSYQTMPREFWDHWHQAVIVVLALMAPTLVALDIFNDRSVVESLVTVAIIGTSVTIGLRRSFSPLLRKLVVCLGFLSSFTIAISLVEHDPSAVYITFFCVVMVCLAFYDSVTIFLIVIVYLVVKDMILDREFPHLQPDFRSHHALVYGMLFDLILVLVIFAQGFFRSYQSWRQHKLMSELMSKTIKVARRANQSAEQAEIERDHLYGSVLHTFKTPLTAIQANAELLGDDRFSEATHERQRQGILAACDELNAVISKGTDAFRSGAWQVESRRISDIESFVSLAVETYQATEPRLHYTTNVDLLASPIAVKGDITALKIVMHHLIENALKYSPPGSEVRVETSLGDPLYATICVTNETVPGQDPLSEELFEPFVRGGASQEGSGLGLYVCQNYISSMLGGISIHNSKNEVSLRVALPLANAWESVVGMINQETMVVTQEGPVSEENHSL